MIKIIIANKQTGNKNNKSELAKDLQPLLLVLPSLDNDLESFSPELSVKEELLSELFSSEFVLLETDTSFEVVELALSELCLVEDELDEIILLLSDEVFLLLSDEADEDCLLLSDDLLVSDLDIELDLELLSLLDELDELGTSGCSGSVCVSLVTVKLKASGSVFSAHQ